MRVAGGAAPTARRKKAAESKPKNTRRPRGWQPARQGPGGAMSFGRHLRALCEGAGLSRPEAARRAAVPVSTLRNWEADRGFPSLAALMRLAGVLGVPVERLKEIVPRLPAARLEKAGAAQHYIEERRNVGKVVLTVA